MRTRARIIRLTWAIFLGGAICCAPAARGQQTSASLTPDQEFVAAIRRGETARCVSCCNKILRAPKPATSEASRPC